MAIEAIGNLASVTLVKPGQELKVENKDLGTTFADYFKDALNQANSLQVDSQKMTDDFAAGRTDNMHQVMIAAEKADIAIQFTMQIRNKVMDAYNEIMRIPI